MWTFSKQMSELEARRKRWSFWRPTEEKDSRFDNDINPQCSPSPRHSSNQIGVSHDSQKVEKKIRKKVGKKVGKKVEEKVGKNFKKVKKKIEKKSQEKVEKKVEKKARKKDGTRAKLKGILKIESVT